MALYLQTDHFAAFFAKTLRTVKPLSHWTATVLRQLATYIASGSQSSLETVASDSQFLRICRQVAQKSRENFEHVQKFYATKFLAKWSQSHRGCLEPVANLSPTPRNLVAIILEHKIFARQLRLKCEPIAT